MQISNDNYKYKYVEREEFNYLKDIIYKKDINSIFINGKSGVGKTTLVKNLFQNNNLSSQVVYFDVLDNKDYIKEHLIEIFALNCLFSEKKSNRMDIMNLENKNTLSYYIDNININKIIKKSIISLLRLTANLISIPINDFITYFENDDITNQINREFEFSKIINEYICKTFVETPLYVIIDNIQELSTKNIQQFRNIFINSNCKFIQIHREKENEYLIEDDVYKYSIFSYEHNIKIIELPKYDYKTVEKILSINIHNYEKLCEKEKSNLISEIIEKSNYNAYEVKNLISQYNRCGNNVTLYSISNTIQNLDIMSKQILYLIANLKKGIRKELLEKVFKLEYGRSDYFNEAIKILLTQQFISDINYSNGLIKFEHEKVISTISNLSNEEFEQINSINETLINILINDSYENEEYFISNINSILLLTNLSNLGKDLYLVFKYIDFLYTNCLYSEITNIYINNIVNELKIIHFFPLKIITAILDSLQKSGKFEYGINLVKELTEYTNLNLFEAKYLIQQYKYDEALKILENNLENNEAMAIYINSLLHLRADNKAQKITNIFLEKNSKDIYHYLVLRNTAHLYEYDIALKHLKDCEKYFSNQQFYLATSKNNLGIIYLYMEQYTIAKNFFESAKKIFDNLKAVDIYQSYFNLSTYYILTENYNSAKEAIEKGFDNVPKNLKYDIYKFKNNLYILEYLLKKDNDKYELYEKMDKLLKKVDKDIIPDPNLKYLLAYNLESLKPKTYTSEIIEKYTGRPNIYNINLKKNDMDFLLSISPHWRF